MKRRLDFNAPVTLTYTGLSFLILLLSYATSGMVATFLSIYFTSWLDPFMYLRLFTHTFVHASFSHFAGNFMMILLLGPLLEQKYSQLNLVLMMLVTSVATGLVNIIFFRGTALLGASGVVFMMILLASISSGREGTIPITFILVALFYIGNEVITGLTAQDNISHISHIIGGICGTFFGFRLRQKQ